MLINTMFYDELLYSVPLDFRVKIFKPYIIRSYVKGLSDIVSFHICMIMDSNEKFDYWTTFLLFLLPWYGIGTHFLHACWEWFLQTSSLFL